MNKKSKIFFIIVFLVIIFAVIVIWFNSNSNQNNGEYLANKISTTENENTNYIKTPSRNQNNNTNLASTPAPPPIPTTKIIEEELTTFSTKIYSTDSARQNNIQITCNSLNDTTVKNGEIFSFCNTVGQSTTSKGYQKADIFDNKGNIKKGLGGGNCQVSTTLYNALLNVPRFSGNRKT